MPSTWRRQSEPLDLPPLGPMRDPAVKPVPLICTRTPTVRTEEMRSLFGQPSRDAALGAWYCVQRIMAHLSLRSRGVAHTPLAYTVFPFTVYLDPRATTAAETPARLPSGFHHRRRLAHRPGHHNEAARGAICTDSAACHLRNTANIGRLAELPQSGWRPAHAFAYTRRNGPRGARETLARVRS